APKGSPRAAPVKKVASKPLTKKMQRRSAKIQETEMVCPSAPAYNLRRVGFCAMFASYRRSRLSLIALAFLTLPLFVAPSPAAAQLLAFFSVSPNGSGSQCTLESPCALQTAMANCYDQAKSVCDLRLNDGVYADPGVNIFYYRKITLTGNCNAPQNVI